MVIIESPILTSEQKTRIGERVITALQHEGILPGSVVVQFQPERGDIYLDGLLIQSQAVSPAALPAPLAVKAPAVQVPQESAPDPKGPGKLPKAELERFKSELVKKLQLKGSLSSFEAQGELGLKESDWAPSTLRGLFTELEEEGLIIKTGQKRGTRYVWNGAVPPAPAAPVVKLVKAEIDEA